MKNTTALKTFATSSRTTLIEQMRGRVKQLLDDPKAAAEYPHDVRALRDAVDEHGLTWVADTAAYTWFNRLTAARYMDANGFSGPFGVVSPAAGSVSALPEILTRAQAGEFPEEVPPHVQASVADLLTRKRTSTDPDAEAYILLLSAMFASWHKPMPEVFPAAVDWIRLLTPLDMLAPTSVRARAMQAMDAEACENVEVVGWLYQFYNSELKKQINDSGVLIDTAELPAVTQLFTPHWIVRYVVENSLGRLWLRSRPSSSLREYMRYYIEPIAGQEDTGVTVATPEEIRVLDPACGSGHMLTYAFDLLFRIYEDEGYTPSSIPQLILTHNLHGLEIDQRAAQLASFALAMKARAKDRRFFTRRGDNDQPVQPNVARVTPLDFDEFETKLITGAVAPEKRTELARLVHSFKDADTFGSLIRVDPDALESLTLAIQGYEETDVEQGIASEVEFVRMQKVRALSRQARALANDQYHVVVANPPYLGSGNMSEGLYAWMVDNYTDSSGDLLTAFIVRASELCRSGTYFGMIVLPSWMYLKSYATFRSWLLKSERIESMLHLGRGVFGSDYGSVAFVCGNSTPSNEWRGTYRRLFDEHVEVRKLDTIEKLFLDYSYNSFAAKQSEFSLIPGAPIAYWLSRKALLAFTEGNLLGGLAAPKSGMKTGDNGRFLRLWFEVSADLMKLDAGGMRDAAASGKKWFPHIKGGSWRRWWGNRDYVINWGDSGRELRDFHPHCDYANSDSYFTPCISWSKVSSKSPTFRYYSSAFIFGDAGPGLFPNSNQIAFISGALNSTAATALLEAISPGSNTKPGELAKVPLLSGAGSVSIDPVVNELMQIFGADWNDYDTSWDFEVNPIVGQGLGMLDARAKLRWDDAIANAKRAQGLEEANNRHFAKLYDLESDVDCEVPLDTVSLTQNPYFRYAPTKGTTRTDDEYRTLFDLDLAKELISYAVGCMMGRYSLDKPGLILADAGATIADFDAKVQKARFRPDTDGIIPITAEHYFEDDIVARMREFLSVAFGKENIEANVAWLEFALGSGRRKSLRDYFLKDFYNDHVKMYSRRHIYWQVSSNSKTDKGFNALFYLHRYTPATLGVIRENYANQMTDKQQARLETIEHALPTASKAEATKLSKERDQLATQRREIRDWITNKLFPLSTAEVKLDLDDGVKQNYPKLQGVLRKVTGL